MQSIYLQRVMMIKPYCGFLKTNPIKANNQSLITNHLEGKPNCLTTFLKVSYAIRGPAQKIHNFENKLFLTKK